MCPCSFRVVLYFYVVSESRYPTMRQAHRSWSKAELKTLKKLWESGAHINVIMRTFNITKNSIIGKATRSGYTRKCSRLVEKAVPKKRKRGGGRFLKGTQKVPPHPPLYTPTDHIPLIGTSPVPMEKLEKNQCKFPFGHKPDMVFCAKETNGGSYCDHHHSIAFLPRRAQEPIVLTLKEDVREDVEYG